MYFPYYYHKVEDWDRGIVFRYKNDIRSFSKYRMMTITNDINAPSIPITSLMTIFVNSDYHANVYVGYTILGTTKEIVPIFTSVGKAQEQILAFFVYIS